MFKLRFSKVGRQCITLVDDSDVGGLCALSMYHKSLNRQVLLVVS